MPTDTANGVAASGGMSTSGGVKTFESEFWEPLSRSDGGALLSGGGCLRKWTTHHRTHG